MDLVSGAKASDLVVFPPNPVFDDENNSNDPAAQGDLVADAELEESDLAEGDFDVLSSNSNIFKAKGPTIVGVNVVNTSTEVDPNGKRFSVCSSLVID